MSAISKIKGKDVSGAIMTPNAKKARPKKSTKWAFAEGSRLDETQIPDYILWQMNEVANGIEVSNPALFVDIFHNENLMAALNCQHAPFAPLATPQATNEAFRAWLVQTAETVQNVQALDPAVPTFDHLFNNAANNIVYSKWQIIHWLAAMDNANIQPFARVYQMDGIGVNCAEVQELNQVFHL